MHRLIIPGLSTLLLCSAAHAGINCSKGTVTPPLSPTPAPSPALSASSSTSTGSSFVSSDALVPAVPGTSQQPATQQVKPPVPPKPPRPSILKKP